MDRLEALGSSLSQISMYDIKSMYEQAKNVVLNVSEIEAKVREATNEDPWGASSTLMQDIANRTFNYADFNEIMPSIYSRFMEKEARQWRQIYKALQLLEYLIKNGSERVVDDARSHISTVKMLRNFHYIDDNGKDQGINVRNRSKELIELLGDVDKIRSERRKAKANKHKYTGTGNDGMSFGGGYGGFSGGSDGFSGGSGGFSGGSGGFSGGSSRFGGFGSESFNDHYTSGGGFSSGGGSSGGFRDSRTSGGFEEYDAGGDDLASPSSPRRDTALTSPRTKREEKKKVPEKPKEPEVDLLGGFDDPAPATTTAPPAAASNSGGAAFGGLDDDFDDFQQAPASPAATAVAAQQPAAPVQPPKPANPNAALMDLFNSAPLTASPSPPIQQQQQQSFGAMGGAAGFGMGGGGFAQGVQAHRPTGSIGGFGGGGAVMTPQTSTVSSPVSKPGTPAVGGGAAKPKSSGNFDDLWNIGLGGSAKPAAGAAQQKSISEMQKEKANSSLWGAGGQAQPKGFNPAMMGGAGSNLGGFSSSSGGDSLL